MLYDIVRVHGVHRLDLSQYFLKINFNRWWILDCKTKKYWKISLDIYILSLVILSNIFCKLLSSIISIISATCEYSNFLSNLQV